MDFKNGDGKYGSPLLAQGRQRMYTLDVVPKEPRCYQTFGLSITPTKIWARELHQPENTISMMNHNTSPPWSPLSFLFQRQRIVLGEASLPTQLSEVFSGLPGIPTVHLEKKTTAPRAPNVVA